MTGRSYRTSETKGGDGNSTLALAEALTYDPSNEQVSMQMNQEGNLDPNNPNTYTYENWNDHSRSIKGGSNCTQPELYQQQYDNGQNQQWGAPYDYDAVNHDMNQQMNNPYPYDTTNVQNQMPVNQYMYGQPNPQAPSPMNPYADQQLNMYNYGQQGIYHDGQEYVGHGVPQAGEQNHQQMYNYGEPNPYGYPANMGEANAQNGFYTQQNLMYPQQQQDYYSYPQGNMQGWQGGEYHPEMANGYEYYPQYYEQQEPKYNGIEGQVPTYDPQHNTYAGQQELMDPTQQGMLYGNPQEPQASEQNPDHQYQLQGTEANSKPYSKIKQSSSLSAKSFLNFRALGEKPDRYSNVVLPGREKLKNHDNVHDGVRKKWSNEPVATGELKLNKNRLDSFEQSNRNRDVKVDLSLRKKLGRDEDPKTNEIYIEARIPRKTKQKPLSTQTLCPVHSNEYRCPHRVHNRHRYHKDTLRKEEVRKSHSCCPCSCNRRKVKNSSKCMCFKKDASLSSFDTGSTLADGVQWKNSCPNHHHSCGNYHVKTLGQRYHVSECHGDIRHTNTMKHTTCCGNCSSCPQAECSLVCSPCLNVTHQTSTSPSVQNTPLLVPNQSYNVFNVLEKPNEPTKVDKLPCRVIVTSNRGTGSTFTKNKSFFPCFSRTKKSHETSGRYYSASPTIPDIITVKSSQSNNVCQNPFPSQTQSKLSSNPVYVVTNNPNNSTVQVLKSAQADQNTMTVSECRRPCLPKQCHHTTCQKVHCIGMPPSMAPDFFYSKDPKNSPRRYIVNVIKRNRNMCRAQSAYGTRIRAS